MTRARSGAPAVVEVEFDRLVTKMEELVPLLRELILERVGQRFPGWEAHSAFPRGRVDEFVEQSLQGQLRAFRRDALPSTAPRVDALAARTVARVGELSAFLGGYRAAQAVLWEQWFGLIEDSVLEGEARRSLLTRGSDFFFRHADLLGEQLNSIYDEERGSLRGERSQRVFASVKALLEGEQPASPGDLGIDLHQNHLALVAGGEHCDEAARAIAKALGRPLFLLAPLEGICWGWVSGARPLGGEFDRALVRFSVPDGTLLALGTEEFGEEGFRASHRQAQRARLLADHSSPLTRYADIAIEALASENPEEARRFVARELGAIDDGSKTALRLRETLAAYFAAEHNAASAAAVLGVHQQTVANRLRVAEERLGHPIGARRVELEMALRLRSKLPTEFLQEVGA